MVHSQPEQLQQGCPFGVEICSVRVAAHFLSQEESCEGLNG